MVFLKQMDTIKQKNFKKNINMRYYIYYLKFIKKYITNIEILQLHKV